MDGLTVGDTVHNQIQRSIIRWLGFVDEIPIIGMELIDSTLPGYTDGTCPLNNNRYFTCPNGKGYYVLENGFIDSYEIIQKNIETNKTTTTSDDEFSSAEQSLSTSPANAQIPPLPIPSVSSPIASQISPNSDNNHFTSSPSRGVLSRLTSEREQRKCQQSSPPTSHKNSFHQASSMESDPLSLSPPRKYHPENYRSTSYDHTNELEFHPLTTSENENHNNIPLLNTNDDNQTGSDFRYPSFGHEYFLNGWTLVRVRSFLENEISTDNQLCLNIYNDQNNVNNLIDEQINNCGSLLPIAPPKDIRIELIKLFDHVEIIFLSRAVNLYNNDYLLLAILCSNNQCAYIRTSKGWAYTDDDNGQPIVIDEITQMINHCADHLQYESEQCRHVLKNACYLYYKLVE